MKKKTKTKKLPAWELRHREIRAEIKSLEKELDHLDGKEPPFDKRKAWWKWHDRTRALSLKIEHLHAELLPKQLELAFKPRKKGAAA